jgi:Protein of unknown function DUF262
MINTPSKLAQRELDLIQKLANCQFAMTSFTWCNEQIVKLIASISQSFPIGAILTIEVNSNSSFTFKPRLLEGVRLKEEPIPESLILDGQQRLTSMFMCLRSGAAVSIRDRQTHRVQERWYYIGHC